MPQKVPGRVPFGRPRDRVPRMPDMRTRQDRQAAKAVVALGAKPACDVCGRTFPSLGAVNNHRGRWVCQVTIADQQLRQDGWVPCPEHGALPGIRWTIYWRGWLQADFPAGPRVRRNKGGTQLWVTGVGEDPADVAWGIRVLMLRQTADRLSRQIRNNWATPNRLPTRWEMNALYHDAEPINATPDPITPCRSALSRMAPNGRGGEAVNEIVEAVYPLRLGQAGLGGLVPPPEAWHQCLDLLDGFRKVLRRAAPRGSEDLEDDET